ncbi:MAG: sugar phosphate nucleotidyltransferase [Candidatus Marinimicrobia bacterium]|jgi:glucose-1-phosphate thymidylyltransferase|nr:sugar phosphate nucleotidyltransferase [Candidatus Neomarinimicrobiota bacterium]
MKAIIPAAGVGTRLRPHTFTNSKVMLSVAGKPIISHIVDRLIEAGITELSIIVGYMGQVVEDYFEENYSIQCEFPIQKEMKGLGHAILQGLDDSDEPALIILGDTIIETDFRKFVLEDENILAVVKVDNPKRFGIVETDSEDNITKMVEKPDDPKSDLAIAGIYLVRSQKVLKLAIEKLISENITTKSEYQITDALQIMINNGEKIQALKIDDWYDCGTRKTLLSTNKYLLSKTKKTKKKFSNSIIKDNVFIGENVKIADSIIGPNVSLGNETKIDNSIISNTIINKNTTISNKLIIDSIIGESVIVKGELSSLNIGNDSIISDQTNN